MLLLTDLASESITATLSCCRCFVSLSAGNCRQLGDTHRQRVC